MARLINFNGTSITVADYKGEHLFNLSELALALGYKGNMKRNPGADVLHIGTQTYVTMDAVSIAMNGGEGKHRDLVAGFRKRIEEEYGIGVAPSVSMVEVSRDPENQLIVSTGSLAATASAWQEANNAALKQQHIVDESMRELEQLRTNESEAYSAMDQNLRAARVA